MNKKLITKILLDAINILETRGWTRGAFARMKNGEECLPTNKNACRFCALGAIELAIIELGHPELKHYYSNTIDVFLASQNGVRVLAEYNDEIAKDKRYVIRMFKRAIKKLNG